MNLPVWIRLVLATAAILILYAVIDEIGEHSK